MEGAVIKLFEGMYDGLEEAPFKRIETGYVFQARNPWFFGRSRHYLVNEAQKAAIAACLRDTLRELRPVAVVAMFVLPLLTLAGAFLLIMIGTPTPVAIIVLMVFVFGPYLGGVHVYTMGRLRHLVAGLPRSSERITLREANANAAAHMPVKLRRLLLVCMAVGLVATLLALVAAYFDGHLLRSLPYVLPAVVFSALGLVFLGKAMIGRGRRGQFAR
jgi:hypothetical protein